MQESKTQIQQTAIKSNEALERNAQSFMKRTIAACIGLGDEHQDNVSLIGRLSWGRFISASVGDRKLPRRAADLFLLWHPLNAGVMRLLLSSLCVGLGLMREKNARCTIPRDVGGSSGKRDFVVALAQLADLHD